MRVIIAGGRDFSDFQLLKGECNRIIRDVEMPLTVTVVCGEARGADSLGKQYAELNGYGVISMPADWDKHGKSAGYKRNEEMAIVAKKEDGILIAFWDGKSRGTKHMIDLATKHGLRIYTIRY